MSDTEKGNEFLEVLEEKVKEIASEAQPFLKKSKEKLGDLAKEAEEKVEDLFHKKDKE